MDIGKGGESSGRMKGKRNVEERRVLISEESYPCPLSHLNFDIGNLPPLEQDSEINATIILILSSSLTYSMLCIS